MKSVRYSALILFFFAILIFRVFYGLNNRFWDADEKHIYLLGLELFSFQKWPYFGADIIHTLTQIPGALQSFLVGGAFFLAPLPETPFVVVNILSMLGLFFFSLYLTKHFPRYSLLSFFAWINSLPWALEFSTHVYNPSYLVLPNFLFFIAFFESLPSLRKGFLSEPLAFGLMGAALAWIAQIHLSWPILIPFLAMSAWSLRKKPSELIKNGLICGLAFGVIATLVLPTVLEFGWRSVLQLNTENAKWNFSNLLYFFDNIFRLICYASYESFLFIGENKQERTDFLLKGFYLIPFFAFLTLITFWQNLYFFYSYTRQWRENNPLARTSLKLFIFALLSSSFVFILSSRPPVSRNLYLLFPLSIWCVFVSLDFFMTRYRWGLRFLHILTILGLSYHLLVAINRYRNFPGHSLYSNRELVMKALQEHKPYLLTTPRYRDKIDL